MSQWNALNVNVITARKIECHKLSLPALLTKAPSACTTKMSIAKPKFTSTGKKSNEYKGELSKSQSSDERLMSLAKLSNEDSFNSSIASDEVFQRSFETPPEKENSLVKISTRYLSLPGYLSLEQRDSYKTEKHCRPRCLFEEALHFESSPSTVSCSSGEHSFPRDLEQSLQKKKASRTSHAVQMKRLGSSSPITQDENNNSASHRNTTKSSFNARDWEQKVLVITSEYELGTEFSKKTRKDNENRPKSVALTGNISTIDKVGKTFKQERQIKSESKSYDMPKLQTVVWDYIKRRSTKRKRKTNATEKQDSIKPTNQESCSENVANIDIKVSQHEQVDLEDIDNRSAVNLRGRERKNSWSDTSKLSRLMKKWKSTSDLKQESSTHIPLQRYDSFKTLRTRPLPKLPAKKLNSDSLTFMLTTATGEKSMEERMQTLKKSREWLLKELQSMREQDRRLAKQFIHLRGAIVQIKEYFAREDLDYDSEPEQGTHNTSEISHTQNNLLKECKIQIHDTPTRNILSFC